MNDVDQTEQIRAMLDELGQLDEQERLEAASENPRMVTKGFLAMARAALASSPSTSAAEGAVAWIAALEARCANDPGQFPLGRGPLESVARALWDEEIDREVARRHARDPENAIVTRISARALLLVIRTYAEDEWERARALAIVLLAATDTLGRDGEEGKLGDEIVETASALLTPILVRQPDPDLFGDVTRRLELRAESSQGAQRGVWLFALGARVLDTYTAGRNPDLYRAQIDGWSRTGGDDRLPLAARGMPTPEEALEMAWSKLSQAAALLEGRARGLARKALVQCDLYRAVGLGVAIDLAATGRAARDAIALLDPGKDAHHLGMIRHATKALNLPGDWALPSATSAAQAPLPKHLAASPQAALDVLLHPLLTWLGAARSEANAIATPEAIVARAEEELGSGAPRAQVLLALALRASRLDQSVLGLNLLEVVKREGLPLPDSLSTAIDAARAVLLDGAGVEAFQAERLPQALEHYASAAIRFELLDLLDASTLALGRAADCANQSQLGAIQMVQGFGPVVPRLESRLGAAGARHCQSMVSSAITALLENGAGGMVIPTLSFAKGARFAVALTLGVSEEELAAAPPDEVESIRRGLAALHVADVGQAVAEGWKSFDESLFLAAPEEDARARAGETEVERLINVQRRVHARASARTVPPRPIDYAVDDATRRRALGPKSALVDFYVQSQLDRQRLLACVSTTAGTKLSVGAWRPRSAIRTDDTVWADDATLRVRALRSAIELEPGPRPVNKDALGWLDSVHAELLAPLEEELGELSRAGIDHLVVVPHGPYHFCPLHLAGPDGASPLADRFLVTYLPNLRLLVPRPRAAREGLLAVGMTFAGTERELADSASACDRVAARVSPATTLVDAAATRDAFAREIQRRRYVHLSTHGRQHVEAASFHELSLKDGPFFALDALRLDLRGVDVLSLAACETALGRFDASDNLSGLPASFFRAGVQTIVATLWPVRPAPAGCFFDAFYDRVGRDGNKLAAFREAQTATRKAFPKMRDWGAFVFLGAWSDARGGRVGSA